MFWTVVILAAVLMLALGFVASYVLGVVNRKWHVKEDPLIHKVVTALAGRNCGACGYPTCYEYATAIVEKGDAINKCLPGGVDSVKGVAAILNLSVEAHQLFRNYAIVHCGARPPDKQGGVSDYRGEKTCAAADIISGFQRCTYGCVGLGDCERSCPYDAIHVIDGLAVVDFFKCTACGACVRACPRKIIALHPFKADDMLVVACCNKDPGKETRRVCRIGCIACGQCVKACELFTIRDNLSHLDYINYDPQKHIEQLKAASEICPVKCLPFRGKTSSRSS